MKIVSWNVNSIRARIENVEILLKQSPDVILFQELKCEDHNFPAILEDYGYNTAVFGQKTYNGVAICSKYLIEDVIKGIPNFDDKNSRYIEAFTNKIKVASIYVPNGAELNSDSYKYKLSFLNAFKKHTANLNSYNENIIIGGDYNIAPTDFDIKNPKKWQNNSLTSDTVRGYFSSIRSIGYVDIFAKNEVDDNNYTWWDYRKASFAKNDGLRIDTFLINDTIAHNVSKKNILKEFRSFNKPSDHAPILIEFE